MNVLAKSARAAIKPLAMGNYQLDWHFNIWILKSFLSLARFYATEAPAASEALRLTFVVPHKVNSQKIQCFDQSNVQQRLI